jgi:voltage-gated potassium channel
MTSSSTPTPAAATRSAEVRSNDWEGRFQIPTFVAALLVIPTLVIEESGIQGAWRVIAAVLDGLIWGVFLAQVVVLLIVTPDRRKWILRHPLEVCIVLLTPPFLPASLQSARILRLLRVFRIAITARSLRRYLSFDGLRIATVLAIFGILGAGAIFADFEHISPWDGVWWAIGTVTTMGSEIYPHTTEGRIVAIVILVLGVGYVAVLTGALTQFFVRAMHAEVDEGADLGTRIDALSREIASLRDDIRRLSA